MARRGPKGNSPAEQAAKGETRPSRKVVPLFQSVADRPDPDNLPAPEWLGDDAAKIWQDKVARYRQRGQKIDGFQDLLAQYCALEAKLIKMYAADMTPTMAMVSNHRALAAEFYDSPASQKVPAGGNKTANNAFARNGQRASAAT